MRLVDERRAANIDKISMRCEMCGLSGVIWREF